MMYLNKAIHDPSWHNDLSIVLTVSALALACLIPLFRMFEDDDYIPRPTKKQRKIWEEEDRRKENLK